MKVKTAVIMSLCYIAIIEARSSFAGNPDLPFDYPDHDALSNLSKEPSNDDEYAILNDNYPHLSHYQLCLANKEYCLKACHGQVVCRASCQQQYKCKENME